MLLAFKEALGGLEILRKDVLERCFAEEFRRISAKDLAHWRIGIKSCALGVNDPDTVALFGHLLSKQISKYVVNCDSVESLA